MKAQPHLPTGSLLYFTHTSKCLQGNPLGDPHIRTHALYLPATHKENLPLLVYLAGFMGSGLGALSWRAFQETLPQRLDRLLAKAAMPPVALLFPDCFTRLGGNQYINSVGTGRYADFLCQELVPFIESTNACGGDGKRGIFGKSSGGYGALMHGMQNPDFWSAVACHSGDMGFAWTYGVDFPACLLQLAKFDSSIENFLRHFERKKKPSWEETHALMLLAMAATYDPDPSAFMGIRLPVTLDTCEWIPERWHNWLRHDPLEIVINHTDALKNLKGLFIDCGSQDEYRLHFGARSLHRKMEQLGIDHRYEEFPDTHMGIDYRLDESLVYLARCLA